MGAVEISGLNKLIYKLEKCKDLGPVKTVVRKNGVDMQDSMARHAESAFTQGYATGTTAGSITGHSIDGGLGYEAQPATHYSPYLEYGTRFMEAEPFVKPAFNEQKEKFISDMKKLVGD